MKISIIIQYYNRKLLLYNTIDSISKSASFNGDTELLVIDDASDSEHSISDINQVYPNFNIKLITFTKEEKYWSCPVIPINKGIASATGDVIIIQGAEIYHMGDILKDIENRVAPNNYLVYASYALPKGVTVHDNISKYHIACRVLDDGGWYQHSIYNNRKYNFCTAILRDDLLDMGGFDERYAYGTSYGDDDFILRVDRKGMNVITIDDPYTYHQYHPGMQGHPSDYTLYQHVLNNENNYKVKNSFLC